MFIESVSKPTDAYRLLVDLFLKNDVYKKTKETIDLATAKYQIQNGTSTRYSYIEKRIIMECLEDLDELTNKYNEIPYNYTEREIIETDYNSEYMILINTPLKTIDRIDMHRLANIVIEKFKDYTFFNFFYVKDEDDQIVFSFEFRDRNPTLIVLYGKDNTVEYFIDIRDLFFAINSKYQNVIISNIGIGYRQTFNTDDILWIDAEKMFIDRHIIDIIQSKDIYYLEQVIDAPYIKYKDKDNLFMTIIILKMLFKDERCAILFRKYIPNNSWPWDMAENFVLNSEYLKDKYEHYFNYIRYGDFGKQNFDDYVKQNNGVAEDFVLVEDDVSIEERLKEQNGLIIVNTPDYKSKPVYITCSHKHNIEQILKDRRNNIFFECTGRKFLNGDVGTSVRQDEPHVRLSFPDNALYRVDETESLLRNPFKKYRIVPKCDIYGHPIKFTSTISRGSIQLYPHDPLFTHDIMSAFHCQKGSWYYVYTFVPVDVDLP